MGDSSSTVVEQLHHNLKGQAISPAPASATMRQKMVETGSNTLGSISSTVVEHLPHHHKVERLSPANASGSWRNKMAREMSIHWVTVVAQ